MFRIAERLGLGLMAMLIIGLAGCPQKPPPPIAPAPEPASPLALQVLARENNQFASDLFHRLRRREGNLIFSPWALYHSLGLLWAGSAGATRTDIARVLVYTLDPEVIPPAYTNLQALLSAAPAAAASVSPDFKFLPALALWSPRDFTIRTEFRERAMRYFRAEILDADFQAAPQSRRQINSWVEGKTEGKITELIPEGMLNPQTNLVLAGALYFKGLWAAGFEKTQTDYASFRVSEAAEVRVRMMRQEGTFAYAQAQDVQVLTLPFQGSNLSMVLILPSALDLARFEENLSAERLQTWFTQPAPRPVTLFLPCFRIASHFEMAPVLAEMGMGSAFRPGADFSGISSAGRLFVSAAVHQAGLEVNEEGAAPPAKTSKKPDSSETPVVFRADHPFLFVIRENTTGAIIYLGRLQHPRLEE